jgi:hypothetical protein
VDRSVDLNLQILQDARDRPDLFQWNGPIEAARLDDWLRQHGLTSKCPPDLVALWCATGGGTYFESETILGPFGDAALGEDLIGVNELYRSRGIGDPWLVFSRGAFLGTTDGRVFSDVDERERTRRGRYGSFNAWYADTVRHEFADRYGLPTRRGDATT